MKRTGLVLAGVVGGMVVFGGSALAAAPSHTGIVPGYGPSDRDKDKEMEWDFGEWNNYGEDNDILDLDLLNELLSSVLSGGG